MRIENIAVALRPRTPWEAMDLGFAMARRWWRPVWAAWAAVYGAAFVLVNLLSWRHPGYAMLALWWLKPCFDRVVLHVLSGAIFGAAPRLRDVLRAWRGILFPGGIAGLLWYRFDLARSFNLPVWQLERARGPAARRRARLLQRRARSDAVWLSVICAHIELALLLALVYMLNMLIPPSMDEGVSWFRMLPFVNDGPARELVLETLYAVAVSLIEPFYVAAGFALYLNRRTQLEGWDVELALRRLNMRVAPLARAAALAALLVAGLLAVIPARPALADEAASSPGNVQSARPVADARAAVSEVLKSPDFDHAESQKEWHYTGPTWDFGGSDKPRFNLGENLMQLLADLLRILAWALAIGAVVWLLLKAPRYLEPWLKEGAARGPPPQHLFGMDIRPESLPRDVAEAALALCAEQRLREALSLLYRAALSSLVHHYGVELGPADTERECAVRARDAAPAADASYFLRLVQAWEGSAYAARVPARADVESLCRELPAHFPQASP